MALSNLFTESSTAIGKRAMAKKVQSVYGYAFLSIFWFNIFMVITVLLGAKLHFSTKSLPFFLPRVVLEIAMTWLGAKAISMADLSTFSFLRLIAIPILLVIDIILGYPISPWQIFGMLIIFGVLVYLLGHKTLNPRGSRYIIGVALISPVDLSLYKYDITHYNSVAAEQILIGLSIMTFFIVVAWYNGHERTWAYLFKRRPESQSLLFGFGSVLNTYAYKYVAASIALTFSRATEIIMAILFGNVVFHERKVGHKLAALAIVVVALLLIAIK